MEDVYICRYCSKICKNKISKAKHEHLCKKNPDYEKHMEIHKNTSVKASKEKDVIDRISKSLKHNRQKFLEDNPDEAYKDFELTCQYQKCGRTFIIRDKVLREAGYLVYRVRWNEINSKFGSIRMKCKINQFLWWFNHQ